MQTKSINALLKVSLMFSITAFSNNVLAEERPQDQAEDSSGWFALTVENDAFGVLDTSDDGYSNGISISWGYGKFDDFNAIQMPGWIRKLTQATYLNQGNENRYAIAYGVSQGMYTPEDIEEVDLIVDDRPYVGSLLWKSRLYSIEDHYANTLGLTLGIVGPAALAEQSQTFIHEIIGARTPNGWDNQINNEPVFRIEAEHIRRLFAWDIATDFSVDGVALAEAGIGNWRSNVGAGVGLRLGNYLAQNFAYYQPLGARSVNTFAEAPPQKLFWQLGLSAYGQYVFNDITMDGNTFKDSHSVELIHDQSFISASIAFGWQHWNLIFSTQRGTSQFEEQKSKTNFGAATIVYNY